MVAHAYNSSKWKAETGESRVQIQPKQHNETLSQNQFKNETMCTQNVLHTILE